MMTEKAIPAKPATMPSATTKAATAAKTATPAVSKPAVKTAVKAVAKPVAKPAASVPAPKPASKPVVKPAAKPLAKTVTQPVTAAPVLTAKPAPKVSVAATKEKLAKAAKALAEIKAKGSVKPAKPAKARKAKLVRDSFTMPETEYSRIAVLKKRLLLRGRETKKSELLRAGLAILSALDDAKLLLELNKVERIKTGRPPKGK